jgi:hypothetical protein
VDPTRGWVVHASVALVLVAGAATTLDVILKGTTVSLTVGGSTVSYSFNAGISGGKVGLLARSAATFTSIRVRTDDAAFLPAKALLVAASAGPGRAPPTSAVTLDSALAAATEYWTAQGVDPARFAAVRVVFGELDGTALAETTDWTITVDRDAAGWGWAVGAVSGRMDLVTMLTHELGHLLGLAHGEGVMEPVLTPGTSWLSDASATPRPAYRRSSVHGLLAELGWAARLTAWMPGLAGVWGSGPIRLAG